MLTLGLSLSEGVKMTKIQTLAFLVFSVLCNMHHVLGEKKLVHIKLF